MRLNRLLTGLFATLLGAFILTGCLNEDNKIPPNCYDGILNNNEEAVDCGGPCEECPPTCFNGEWDVYPDDFGGWVEEGVDCGGPCEACPTCDDGILNQGETGIDCGGIDPETLLPICEDCPPEAGDCTNGLLDGDEIGIDCGGCCCPDCPDTVVDCTDGIWNEDSDEEWYDCGGCCCPDCPEPMVSFILVEEGGDVLLYNAFIQFDLDVNITTAVAVDYPDADPTLTFNSDAPISGWAPGVTIQFNEDTADDRVMTFVVDGDTYTSDDPEANVVMQFTQIDEATNEVGTTITGVFSGVLNLAGGTDEDFTIQGGTFTYVVIP